jgi:hypothetical protein
VAPPDSTPPTAKSDSLAPSGPASKTKKKKATQASLQKELRELSRPDPNAAPKPPVDLKKIGVRVGLLVAVVWAIAIAVRHWIGFAVAGALTLVIAGAAFWLLRTMKKSEALGALLRGADTEEGRKSALAQLEGMKGDSQALLARAQLEMQEDPKKALATLESADLGKMMVPMADQFRAMRAMIHLTLGETAEARALSDELDLGKQQDAKSRAMFATVASEAWARTGQGKKAVETLELFNPDDPEFAEMKTQMWRARAFAYAGANDMKGAGRALRKLAEMNPHLLGMFIGTKKIHPLLEREAKQIVMKMGAAPRRMVRQR